MIHKRCRGFIGAVCLCALMSLALTACGSSGATQRNDKSNSIYELFDEGSPTTEVSKADATEAVTAEKTVTEKETTEKETTEKETEEKKTTEKTTAEKTTEAATEKAVKEEITEEETTEEPASEDVTSTQEAGGSDDGERPAIELDLSAMSGTMVYSEVSNICAYPDDYRGKVIQMRGLYNFYHDDATGNDYYACIIQDATACCASGIEFVPDGFENEITPGEEITVAGTFDTYKEGNFTYPTLRNAWLVSAN